MRKSISQNVFLVLVFLMMTFFADTGSAAAAEDAVVISKSTFPDASLRSCIMELYPEGKISKSELESRTSLDVSGEGIKDLKGVELFENLQEINCSKNDIIEVSINTYLELKNLKRFDISNNTSLKTLTITGLYSVEYDDDDYRSFEQGENYVLESLDVSGCTSLTQLDCSSNLLKTMDIDGCTRLVDLNCSNNNLEALDVRSYKSLKKIDCSGNLLTSLDVSGSNKLTHLNCGDNRLSVIDLNGLSSLVQLYCNNNRLTSLKLKGQTLLVIDCSNNKLSTLDLREAKFTDTSDERIDWEKFAPAMADSFGVIYCQGNKLTSLRLPAGEKISGLDCTDNNLEKLDLSKVSLLARNGYFSWLKYDKNKVKTLLLPKYKFKKLADKEYKGKPVEYSAKSMKISMGGYELNKDEKELGLEFRYRNNKAIGLATVTVKDSNGISCTQTFRIIPRRATIKNVIPGKKKITVKIKNQPGDVKYQISVKRKGSKDSEKKYTVKKGTL